MGIYCCCDWKMTPSHELDLVNKTCTTYEVDPDGCKCDWNGWVSRYNWPEERKNKHIAFSEPLQDGKYLVRCQSGCGDRYEEEQYYSSVPRKINCGYTGNEMLVNWSGNDEGQPYAWKQNETD